MRGRLRLPLLLLAGFSPAALAQTGGACVAGLQVATDHDAGVVTLSWSPTPGALFYDVHRALDGGPSEHVATVDAGETAFVDADAPEGILDYRVAADGHPDDACPAVSTHLGGFEPPPGETTCATGLEARATPEGVRLTWTPVPGALSYDVLRAEADGDLVPYAVLPGDADAFLDAAVAPGLAYRYAVAANGLPPPDVRCDEAAVTAVPDLPGRVAVVLLLVGSLVALHGASAFARRRRR